MDNSPMEKVENRIYHVRKTRVMLDSDLAKLYGVPLKVLTNEELTNLRSQIVTSSWGGRRCAPYVFTEQGVAMLSGVLNSPRAIMVNIEIIRTFVRMRSADVSLDDIVRQLEGLEKKYDKRYEMMFQAIKLIVDKLNKKADKDPRF